MLRIMMKFMILSLSDAVYLYHSLSSVHFHYNYAPVKLNITLHSFIPIDIILILSSSYVIILSIYILHIIYYLNTNFMITRRIYYHMRNAYIKRPAHMPL